MPALQESADGAGVHPGTPLLARKVESSFFPGPPPPRHGPTPPSGTEFSHADVVRRWSTQEREKGVGRASASERGRNRLSGHHPVQNPLPRLYKD